MIETFMANFLLNRWGDFDRHEPFRRAEGLSLRGYYKHSRIANPDMMGEVLVTAVVGRSR